jgi:osmoprotectant transport system substrate-binding protein
VASFDFAESALLAEMYAQLVESTGVPVIRLGPVGPREIIAPAMELGRIDLVPEYLGTALQYEGVTDPNADTGSSLTQLDDLLARRGLTTLAVARAQDTNTIVVARDTADRDDLATISDLAPLAARMRFGGPVECPDRPLCLAGLEEVYGLRFAEFVPQRSLIFTAEALRRGEIEVGLMFSTAPELESADLVELVDDLGMQPAENLVPVVRVEALQRWGPDPAVAIDAMSQELTTADLRRLNRQVSDGDAVEEVVRGWLTERGLLE